MADLAKLKPIHRDNSLNFILHLDVQRYNSLLHLVKSELGALKRAILGLQVYDEQVEQTCNTILLNRIPEHWEQ